MFIFQTSPILTVHGTPYEVSDKFKLPFSRYVHAKVVFAAQMVTAADQLLMQTYIQAAWALIYTGGCISCHGPLARFVKLWVAHALGMPGTFLSNPDMHHGTCVTHVPWCMPESLTSGFLWSREIIQRNNWELVMANRLVYRCLTQFVWYLLTVK